MPTQNESICWNGSGDFVSIDVETTGFYPGDEIVDLAAVRFRSGEVVDKFESLINPQIPIPACVTEIHGITDSDVADAPVVDDIFPSFLEFIADDILVAHNAPFDMRFLNKISETLYGNEIKNKLECTLSLARNLVHDIRNHKLTTLAAHFEIEISSAHRAYPDALAAGQIYLVLLQKQFSEKNTR